MENKNNKGTIILLVIVIILLALLLVLAVKNKQNVENAINNNVVNNITTDNNEETKEDNTEEENKENIIYSADEYISLEDVIISNKITTKKVKINHLSDDLTKEFYDQQSKLIEEAQKMSTYDDEFFNTEYKLEYYINSNVLSILYSIVITDAMGSGCTSKAITNIDLKNNKVISEEELLSKANTSYEKIVDEYYEQELTNWTEMNNLNGNVIDYYEVTYDDFKNNKEKYLKIGMDKIADILYVYIKDNKIVYDYYTINKGTIFHPVGKGGWFNWDTIELGEYK